jgi:hypothetical protein
LGEKARFLQELLDNWEDETIEVKGYFPRSASDAEGKTKFALALAALAHKAAIVNKSEAYLIAGVRNDDRKVVGIEFQEGDKKALADIVESRTDPPVQINAVEVIQIQELENRFKGEGAKGVVYLIRIGRMSHWVHRVYLNGKGDGKYGVVPCRYGPQVVEVHKEDLLRLILLGARKFQEDTGTLPPQLPKDLFENIATVALHLGKAPKLAPFLEDKDGKAVEQIEVQPEYLREEIVEILQTSERIPHFIDIPDILGGKSVPGNFVLVSIAISNDGDGPADNVKGFLEFPMGCELREEREFRPLYSQLYGKSNGWWVTENKLVATCTAPHLTNDLVARFDPLFVRFPQNGFFPIKASVVADGVKIQETILTVKVAALAEKKIVKVYTGKKTLPRSTS